VLAGERQRRALESIDSAEAAPPVSAASVKPPV
jgi:hypothetical protein